MWLEDVKLRAFFEERAQVNLWVRSGGFHAAEIEFLAKKFLGGRKESLIRLGGSGLDAVSVDEVRALRQRLSLGSFSSANEKRLVVIDAKLRVDAQNVLLKILEEPPEGVFFLLLADRVDFYLPTVSSRCQVVLLENANEDVGVEYLQGFKPTSTLKLRSKSSEQEAKLLYMQAGGMTKNLVELAQNSEVRQKSLELLQEAKEFIKLSEFERLVALKKYSSKDLLVEFIEALLIVVELVMRTSVDSALRMGSFYERLELASKNIKLNVNVKLESLRLVS